MRSAVVAIALLGLLALAACEQVSTAGNNHGG
jgi:hypothetical protein